MYKNMISIIIPAYNAEKYIEQCINSIENQTYKNIEVIIINDGSTDNTKTICNKLKKIYTNIIIINQTNKGVSESRNEGILVANGNYIMFVDADDFIENNMLEKMLKNNQNSDDFIVANYKKYYNNKFINNIQVTEASYKKETFLKNFWKLFDAQLINSPCFRLYKTNIIKNNNIRFNSNYELGEDLIFNLQYFEKCNTFKILPYYLYNYRYCENSLTTKYRENYIIIQLQLVEYIKKFFIVNNQYNEKNQQKINELISNVIICSIQNLFLRSANLTNKQIKQKIEEYINLKEIDSVKSTNYKIKKLQLMRYLILNKKVKTIIVYSKLKEILRKIIKKEITVN